MLCCSCLSVFAIFGAAVLGFVMQWFRSKKNVRGQLALITGSGSGIGRELAFGLAKVGCRIAIADIDLESAKKTSQEIRQMYPDSSCSFYKVDVSNYKEIEDLKTRIEADLGPVDILVNNAALLFEVPMLQDRPEHYERMMRVNILSILWTTKVFMPAMIERKRGHIVALASIAGLYGAPKMLMYATSKFAVRGFMDTLAQELFTEGHSKYIKLTTIFPSFVDSNEDIKSFVGSVLTMPRVTRILKTTDVADRIVDAILYEERIVTIPGVCKFVGYYITTPLWMRLMALTVFFKR